MILQILMGDTIKEISKLRQLQDGTIFEQKLQNSKFQVQYESQSCVTEQLNKQSRGSIHVQGTFSRNRQDGFNKITEISVGNKVFIIKEHFDISQVHVPLKTPKKSTPPDYSSIEQFSSQSESEGYIQVQMKRKDRKNIVKNVIKAYMSWIKKELKEYQGNRLIKELVQSFVKNGKYNNTLVVTIIKDERVNPSFTAFLIKQAPKWLSDSKIVDKEAHKQCIQSYLKACNTLNLAELRVFKRKTTRNNETSEEVDKKADPLDS